MKTGGEGSRYCPALVIGASSAIAHEIISQILEDSSVELVVAVSRAPDTHFCGRFGSRLIWIQSDYSETSMDEIVDQLLHARIGVQRVFICNGVLHSESLFPEKRLEELAADSFEKVMQVNALIPILWIKHLKRMVRRDQEFIVTTFSARVGSIEDNHRGGWYSYRASKAALNMLLKSAANEYARVSSRSRFLAFHPGTADTPLSRPFQKSVPAEKLFSPQFVAQRLLIIVNELQQGKEIQYLDWDGKSISW